MALDEDVRIRIEADASRLQNEIQAMQGSFDKLVNSIGNAGAFSEIMGKNAKVAQQTTAYIEGINTAEAKKLALDKQLADVAKQPDNDTRSKTQISNLQQELATVQQLINAQRRLVNTSGSGSSSMKREKTYYDPRKNQEGDSVTQRQQRRSYNEQLREGQRYSAVNRRDTSGAGRYARNSANTISRANEANSAISYRTRMRAEHNYSAVTEKLEDKQTGLQATRSNIASTRNQLGDLENQKQNLVDAQSKRELSKAEKEQMGALTESIRRADSELNDLSKTLETLNRAKESQITLKETLDAGGRVAPKQGTFASAMYRNKGFAGSTLLAGSASLAMDARKGVSTINAERPITREISAINGSYDSNATRKSAEQTGMSNGFSGSQMLNMEQGYVETSGYQGESDLTKAGVSTGQFARASGVSLEDSSALTNAYGSATQGSNASSLKNYQQTFYGAIKQAGLDKYGKSQVQALTTLTSSVANNHGGSMSQEQMLNIAGIQTALGKTGDKGLMGENGNKVLEGVDSNLKNTTSNKQTQLALMMSNPSKFNGSLSGYKNMLKVEEQGITNPQNAKDLLQGYNQMGGGDADISAGMLRRTGIDVTGSQFKKINKAMSNGEFDNLNDKQYQKKMKDQFGVDVSKQQNSGDAKVDKANAQMESATTALGKMTQGFTANVLVGAGLSGMMLALAKAVVTATGALTIMAGKAGITTATENMMTRGGTGKGGTGKGGTASSTLSRVERNSGTTARTAETTTGTLSRVERNSVSGKLTRAGNAVKTRAGSLVTSAVERAPVLATVGNKVASAGSRVAGAGASAVSAGANVLSTVKNSGVAQKGASILSKLGENGAVKAGGQVLNKVGKGNALIGALSMAPAVANMFSDNTNEQKGKQLGGAGGALAGATAGATIGSVIPGVGTVIGGLAGGLIGGMAGDSVGSSIGGKAGKMLDGKGNKNNQTNTVDKQDQANTNKKYQIEQMRKENNSNEATNILKEQGINGKNVTSTKGTSKNVKSGDDSASPYLDDNNTKSAQSINVVISGTVQHKGDVTDMSQVNASIPGFNGTVAQLLGMPTANETVRR